MTASGLEGVTPHGGAGSHTTPLVSPLKLSHSQNYNPFNFNLLPNLQHVQSTEARRSGAGGKRRLQGNLSGEVMDGWCARLDRIQFIFSFQTSGVWKLNVQTRQCASRVEARRGEARGGEARRGRNTAKLIRQTRGINRALVSSAISQQSPDETGLTDSRDG